VLRDVLEVDTVRFLLLSADGSHLYGGLTIGLEDELHSGFRVPVGEGFAGRIAADQRPVVVEHADRFPIATDAVRQAGLHSLAGVPVADHELLGVLHVGSRRRRRFLADDLELLQLAGDRLAMALRQDETSQALQRTEAFSRSVLETAVDAVVTIDERGRISTVNPAARHMFGYTEEELVGRNVSVLMTEGDARLHDRYVARYLETGEARILGRNRELLARRKDGAVFPVELGVSEVRLDGHQRFFTGVIHDITARRKAQEELRHQALHDPLTGLPNRVLFGDHLDGALARSVRSGAPVGVLVVDLDDFKQVNDALGHSGGDELLRQAAARLRAVLRPSDTVARLGGDEFGVLVLDARQDEDVVRVAQRIQSRFQAPFVLEGQHLACTASMGVAQTGGGGDGAAELLRHADAALYRAKERGRDRFEVFDEPMRHRLRARARHGDELVLALARGHIEAWFQPLLDLRVNRISHVEALARWRHPERGTLDAAEFVPVAEDAGLIVELGAYLATHITQARRRWAAGAATVPGLAVNLSPQEIAAVGADALVERLGGGAGPLWFEIAERALAPEAGRLERDLAGLRRRGAKVAVDGFGTGSSSLGRLGGGAVDVLKIDRRFVAGLGTDPAAAAMVEAAAALGRALGLDVVAVGLEGADQLDALRQLGCTHAQGFAISPAVPADEIPAIVRSWH
jgi:diguanylate cyclase (GGDEF)-like protein/PAS domain S-box-containing protein